MDFRILKEIGAIDPMSTFPPAPSGPPAAAPLLPSSSPVPGQNGGLGGFGGFMKGDGFNDMLRAASLSLMTSPRDQVLTNMAQFLPGMQEQSARRRETAGQQQALATILRQAGATDGEAQQLSQNAAVAELWLKQRQGKNARSADAAFVDGLAGIGGNPVGSYQVPEEGSSVGPVAGEPALREAPMIGSGGATPASGKLKGLIQLRNQYVDAAARATTDDQIAKARLYIDNLDQQIAREEDAVKLTEAQRDLREINNQRLAANLPPYRLDEWQQLKARSGATNIDMKGPSEYDKVYHAELAKRATGLQDQGLAGQRAIGTLKLMETALGDEGFYSGAGAEKVATLKRYANALALPGAEGIDSIEAFNALSKQAALGAMGGSLGSGFSNADRDFVEMQVPNLANTREGNLALIRIQRAMAERQQEIARLARAYAAKNDGRVDDQFYDRLARWAEANPMFANPENIFGGNKEGRPGGGSSQGTTPRGLQWKAVQ